MLASPDRRVTRKEQRIMGQKKKDRNMVSAVDRRTKQNSTGPNAGKTRPDVPSTRANKAASGKQNNSAR
jgi:hypothetical protein